MHSKAKIMVVDDDEMSQALIEGILAETFELSFASSGDECLNLLQSQETDVVLLDVNMPEMDGLEVCRHIRSQKEHRATPVIFVSASDSKEEIIAGYEAGADDYITKPLHHDSLLARVEMNAKQARTQAHIHSALTGTSPESINRQFINSPVFQFIDSSSQSNTFEELAQAVFEITTHLDLSCLVQMQSTVDDCYFSDDGIIKPIEPNIIKQMKLQGRCCAFGQRLIINYPQISLFVRNLPIEDELRNVQIKEALLHVVRLADSRLESIQQKTILEEKCEHYKQLHQSCSSEITSIHQSLSRHVSCARDQIKQFSDEAMSEIKTLHLTQDQEDFLNKILTNKVSTLTDQNNKVQQIEESMQNIISQLEKP